MTDELLAKRRAQLLEPKLPAATQADLLAKSSVVQRYAGKTIFVTGATGFIGKVIKESAVRLLAALLCVRDDDDGQSPLFVSSRI